MQAVSTESKLGAQRRESLALRINVLIGWQDACTIRLFVDERLEGCAAARLAPLAISGRHLTDLAVEATEFNAASLPER